MKYTLKEHAKEESVSRWAYITYSCITSHHDKRAHIAPKITTPSATTHASFKTHREN